MSQLVSFIDKSINAVNTSLKYVLFLLMSALVFTVFAQVLFSYINQPLAWTQEVALIILVWLTFLGAAYAMSLRAHISIDFFVNKLPRSLQKISLVLSTIISIAFFYILITEGYSFVLMTSGQFSSVLRIPMSLVYTVIPVSGIILTINILNVTIKTLFNKGENAA